MNAYGILMREYERMTKQRDDAAREWRECMDRAEQLARYCEQLSEDMAELLSARGALLAAKRRSKEPAS